jgi:hypothetical protein
MVVRIVVTPTPIPTVSRSTRVWSSFVPAWPRISHTTGPDCPLCASVAAQAAPSSPTRRGSAARKAGARGRLGWPTVALTERAGRPWPSARRARVRITVS